MKNKKNIMGKIFRFIIRKSNGLLEYYYSVKYYRSFKIPIVNHLTIGIKSLGEKRTFLPHPIGIVIGKKVILGDSCTIYQNVTIGVANNKREIYPVIGDNVVIYANAIVIGEIDIGRNSVIGAGCIVTKNVPENKVAVGSPMRIIDKKQGVEY